MKNIINSNKAPEPIGPYNQAIMTDNVLYISGQIGINRETGILVNDDINAETTQVMNNLGAILHEANLHYSNIVKCTIYVSDLKYFADINKVYGSYFKENHPAREIAQVEKLPLNANVEISAIAVKN